MKLKKFLEADLLSRSYILNFSKLLELNQIDNVLAVVKKIVSEIQTNHNFKVYQDPLNSPDVLFYPNINGLKVNELEELYQFQNTNPVDMNMKICIINNADELSEQIQNKLLKILEEPQNNLSIFLFTNFAHKLKQTILSRTVSLKLTQEDLNFLSIPLNSKTAHHLDFSLDEMTDKGLIKFIDEYKSLSSEKDFLKFFLNKCADKALKKPILNEKLLNLTKWLQESLTYHNPRNERAFFIYQMWKAIQNI